MFKTTFVSVLASAALLAACGSDPVEAPETFDPTEYYRSFDSAHDMLTSASPAIDRARDLLELAGVLPSYECGEEQRSFVGKMAEDLRVELACATIETQNFGVIDAVLLSTGEATCTIGQVELQGKITVLYSTGDDRTKILVSAMDSTLDAQLAYDVCGDETKYTVHASYEDVHVRLELTKRDALFGGSLPTSGEIEITSGLDTTLVRFNEESAVHGTVEVTFNEEAPVTIPYPMI
jgi:hypothetical protein